MPAPRRDEEEARVVHQVAARAVRRLDLLEWVILGGLAVLAAVGGALAAALFAGPLGLPFRYLWIGASLVMFAVPGVLALRKMKREERVWREKSETDTNDGSHV